MDCPSEDHESQTPPDDPAFHIGPTTPQPSSTIPCLQLFLFLIRLWETWNPFNTSLNNSPKITVSKGQDLEKIRSQGIKNRKVGSGLVDPLYDNLYDNS